MQVWSCLASFIYIHHADSMVTAYMIYGFWMLSNLTVRRHDPTKQITIWCIAVIRLGSCVGRDVVQQVDFSVVGACVHCVCKTWLGESIMYHISGFSKHLFFCSVDLRSVLAESPSNCLVRRC